MTCSNCSVKAAPDSKHQWKSWGCDPHHKNIWNFKIKVNTFFNSLGNSKKVCTSWYIFYFHSTLLTNKFIKQFGILHNYSYLTSVLYPTTVLFVQEYSPRGLGGGGSSQVCSVDKNDLLMNSKCLLYICFHLELWHNEATLHLLSLKWTPHLSHSSAWQQWRSNHEQRRNPVCTYKIILRC